MSPDAGYQIHDVAPTLTAIGKVVFRSQRFEN
jgi:hypothetical protein